jgi:thiol:disulfide interchange protein DsbC
MKKQLLILGLALAVMGTVSADVDKKVSTALEKKLATLIPGQVPSSIKTSVIDGLYEIAYGAQIFYISEDGKYLVQGDMIDLESRKSLTQEAAKSGRSEIMKSVKDSDTIVYSPKGKTEHTITVFTDIDCPYCRKMHEEMQGYNDAGIAVRYMLYPRAGLNSPAYKKAVSVWCAKDRAAAMDDAKLKGKIDSKTCENPVQRHMEIGEEVGVTGTPAIVLEDGSLIPGYRPAKDMARMLNKKVKVSSK